jgi:hypothetical protein
MKKATFQDIFNAAWQKFIIEDGKPARDIESLSCEYLTKDGNKCAVGLVIPDGHPAQKYFGDFHQLVTTDTVDVSDIFDEEIMTAEEHTLIDFQADLHDRISDRNGNWINTKDAMREHYIRMAEKYHLTVPK